MPEFVKPKIIVAMPAYNEEKYIGSVVLAAKHYASEVIVVNDGSDDCTSKIASLAGATVLNHEKNEGKGSTIQTILVEASKKKPDVLVIMDADGQHKSDEIPRLVKSVLAGNDLVIGSRKLQKDINTPLYRKVGQKILLYLTNFQSGKQLTDTESGFRAFSSRAISELNLEEDGFAVETEMILKAKSKGLKISEVSVSNIYTHDGSTLNPVRHGLQVLGSLVLMISATRLISIFWVGGILSIALGFLAFARFVNIYYQSREIPVGTTFAAVLLIVVGVQSIFTGILLKRLARIKKWNH